MVRYTIRRILMLIPVMLGVVLVVFIFQSFSPDNPVTRLLGASATEADYAALTAKLGLDKPIIVQYLNYIYNFFFHLDLGTSYTSGQSVLYEIMIRWPYTIELAVVSVLLAVVVGIPLGILSAVKQYTWIDNAVLGFSVLGASFPSFWLALLLIVLFSAKLGWLPSTGIMSWKGWVMPMFVVMIGSMTNLIRTTRSSMLESIRQDYVTTARAKGLSEKVVIWHHVVRNSMIPVVNGIGLTIGVQLGGALIIENIFGIPGIGQYCVTAINTLDFPVVRGSVVILAFVFSVVNLLCDLIYTILDPKLKLTFAASVDASRRKRMAEKNMRLQQDGGSAAGEA